MTSKDSNSKKIGVSAHPSFGMTTTKTLRSVSCDTLHICIYALIDRKQNAGHYYVMMSTFHP